MNDGPAADDLPCGELVELITDYLEGALDPTTRHRFEEHLAECDGCETYLEQMRRTVREVGRVDPERLDAETRDALVSAFRGWASGGEG